MSNKDLTVKRVGGALLQEEQKPNKSTLGMPSTGNKPLYIVVVEDPSSKQPFRVFGTTKPDKTASYLEFIGYELTTWYYSKQKTAQIEQLRTYEDAIELGTQEKAMLINIVFPWNRVISIKNVTFSHKAKSA